MSPFGIFTIVLIIAYVIYYAIMISRDLYGKKGRVKNEEEEFDVSSLEDEESAVGVQESGEGFSLLPLEKKGVKTDIQPLANTGIVPRASDEGVVGADGKGGGRNVDASKGVDGDKAVAGNVNDSPELRTVEAGGKSATDERIEKVQEEMDVIDPTGNLTMSKEFFRDLLMSASKEGSLFVNKVNRPAV